MTNRDSDERSPPCPACGSSQIFPLDIAEHKRCGAVKPLEEFRVESGYECPDCHLECSTDSLSSVGRGSLVSCMDCGKRYDSDVTSDDVRDRETSFSRDSLPSFGNGSTRTGDRLTLPVGGRVFRKALTVFLMLFIISSAVVTAVGTAPLLEDQAESSGDWKQYQSVVIFRNDDIQPYYRRAEMEAVDEVFVEEGVPVTQGVIPRNDNESLDPNQQLCQYLRDRATAHPDLFEFALHGYTHEELTSFHSGSEFGGLAYEKQHHRISEGTRTLESCIGERPRTFIPPLDTYDNNTVRALVEANYTVVSGGGWFTNQYYGETRPFETNGLLHVPNSQSFVKNWSTNEFYSEQAIERRFDRAYQNQSLYMQMLHYPTFTDESKLETLRGVIEHMKSKEGVRFMTVGSFAEKYQSGELKRVDDGWLVWEESDSSTTTLSDRVDGWMHEIGEKVSSTVRITEPDVRLLKQEVN